LLQLGGLAEDPVKAAAMVGEALDSGQAAETFSRMVVAQGGPSNLLQSPENFLPAAPLVRAVFPDEAGFVTRVGTRRVGQCVIVLGGGRQRAEDEIDPSVGLSQIAGVGVEVGPQHPLAVIHASSEDSWKHAAQLLRSGFTIGPERLDPGPPVHAGVQGGVPHARH
jgi:thymidine phosphorylase